MKKFLKIGCLGLILLFILIVVIGFMLGKTVDDSEKETKQKAKTVETSQQQKTLSVSIGQDLRVGDVVFKVNEISSTQEIVTGNGYVSYKPESQDAEFFVVNVTVKNEGKEAITTDSSFFTLTDGDSKFIPSNIISTDDKFFMYDGINPGLAKTGNVLFEIPEGKKGLNLNVQTGFWGTEQGEIKIN